MEPYEHLRVRSVGEYEPIPDELTKLPAKEPGVHRWMMAVAYPMTTDEAHSVYDWEHPRAGQWRASADKIMTWEVGCFDCEEPFHDVVDAPCPHPGDD